MKKFQDSVAVITGAGTGMGRSVALALAREGVHVAICDIELEPAEKVRDEARALGVRAIAAAVDVSKLEVMQAFADQVFDEFGHVEILVNNAGVTLRPFRAVWDTAYEDFQWVIAVNIWGVVNGIHVFVPRMRQQDGEKHIVNVSSMSTVVTAPGHSTYTLTKSAVNGFSDTIREELAPEGFGVTLLYPGLVPTRIWSSERLRPENERSENRGVTPYNTYTEAREAAQESNAADESDPNYKGRPNIADAGGMLEPLDPDKVGPMVVEAIRENRPHLFTHPAPIAAIDKRAEALRVAHPGQG